MRHVGRLGNLTEAGGPVGAFDDELAVAELQVFFGHFELVRGDLPALALIFSSAR